MRLVLTVLTACSLLATPAFAASGCAERCSDSLQECMRGCRNAAQKCLDKCDDKYQLCSRPCMKKEVDSGKNCLDANGKPMKCPKFD